MPRLLIASGALAIILSIGMPVHSHAQPAPVTRGMTSADLVEQLRVLNAGFNVRLDDLEGEKDRLSGEIEKLQFLLLQSREQIDALRDGQVATDRLIRTLQEDLSRQEDNFTQLQVRLDAAIAGIETVAQKTGVITNPVNPDDNTGLPNESATTTPNDPVQTAGMIAVTPDIPDIDQLQSRLGQSARIADGERTPDNRQTTAPGNKSGQTLAGGPDLPSSQPEGESLGTIPASALPGEAGALFVEAKALLMQSDYTGAEAKFRQFLEHFTTDPQADEALYWLAEVFHQKGKHADAGRMYADIVRSHPDSEHAPGALAKLARSMRLVDNPAQACEALDLLSARYADISTLTKILASSERARSACDG